MSNLYKAILCTQRFITGNKFSYAYPIKSKAKAVDCLNSSVQANGMMETLFMDGAKEELHGQWNTIRNIS